MKFLLYILLIWTNIACNGQEKSSTPKYAKTKDTAEQAYKKQKYRLEFDTYKMVYNSKPVKLGSMAEMINDLGKEDFVDYGDIIYYNTPINPSAYLKNKLNEHGNILLEYNGKEFSDTDSNGNYIQEYRDLYIDGKARKVYEKDKNGNLVGEVYTYRIWMSPYENSSLVMSKSDSAKIKMPAVNGYIKINGQLIHQSISKKELQAKLYPLPQGGQLTSMLGDPVLIYDLGKNYKSFDPNMDPNDTRVFIDIVFKIDPKTKEEKGIYYINYYYNLKQTK